MKENRLLLCINWLCDLGKIDSKYFFMWYNFSGSPSNQLEIKWFTISTFRRASIEDLRLRPWKFFRMIAHRVGNHLVQFLVFECLFLLFLVIIILYYYLETCSLLVQKVGRKQEYFGVSWDLITKNIKIGYSNLITYYVTRYMLLM